MKALVIGLQWLIRLLFVAQLSLGVLFWTGNAYTLIPLHMLNGLVLVLGVWIQAALAVRAGIGYALPAFTLLWGVIVVALGMSQDSLLPGDLHWLIKVVHLLVGIGLVAQAERLSRLALGRFGAAPAVQSAQPEASRP